jgi:hypothetical protein
MKFICKVSSILIILSDLEQDPVKISGSDPFMIPTLVLIYFKECSYEPLKDGYPDFCHTFCQILLYCTILHKLFDQNQE